MNFHRDLSNNALYVEWEQMPFGGQGSGGFKRAWIRKTTDPAKDWAHTGRYINVAMIPALGAGPGGPSADFSIFNKSLPDDQALMAFVTAICAITGCQIP